MASTVYETDNCCADHLGIEVARLSKIAAFNRGKNLFLYLYKTLLLTTHFQYELMEHMGIFDLI